MGELEKRTEGPAPAVAREEGPAGGIAGMEHLEAGSRDTRDLLNLVSLAQNRAGKARATLVRRLTDLALLPEGHLMPQERALVHEILAKLVEYIEFDLRARLAQRLARAHDAPAELVTVLAHDAIEIAGPLLEHSEALCDADLVSIARECTRAHRRIMAGRRTLSSVVTDILVAAGEVDVASAVAANAGARISREGFAQLIILSEGDDAFQRTLIRREDLTPVLAHTIFWSASSALRLEIVKRFSVDRRLLREALDDAIADGLEEIDADPNLARTLQLMRGRTSFGPSAGAELVSAARSNDLREVVRRLSRLASIRPRTAARIVSDAGGEALAVACKSLGLTRREFLQLGLLVEANRAQGARAPGEVERLTALFDSVATDSADVVLRYWDEVWGDRQEARKDGAAPRAENALDRGVRRATASPVAAA